MSAWAHSPPGIPRPCLIRQDQAIVPLSTSVAPIQASHHTFKDRASKLPTPRTPSTAIRLAHTRARLRCNICRWLIASMHSTIRAMGNTVVMWHNLANTACSLNTILPIPTFKRRTTCTRLISIKVCRLKVRGSLSTCSQTSISNLVKVNLPNPRRKACRELHPRYPNDRPRAWVLFSHNTYLNPQSLLHQTLRTTNHPNPSLLQVRHPLSLPFGRARLLLSRTIRAKSSRSIRRFRPQVLPLELLHPHLR